MGYYTVTISYIGYKTQNKADIWVRPNGYEFLNIKLESFVIQIDDVIVEESYFERSMVKEYQVVSFNREYGDADDKTYIAKKIYKQSEKHLRFKDEDGCMVEFRSSGGLHYIIKEL